MGILKSKPKPVKSKLAPARPDLDKFLASDTSFLTEYFRTLGAIASADGVVNLAEYIALHEILLATEQSSLAGLTILHALENPISLKEAFRRLRKASTSVEPAVLRAAFEAARPLLMIQGNDSLNVARNLAESLGHKPTVAEMDEFVTDDDESIWNRFARQSKRLVRGKQLLQLGESCFRVTGQPEVVKQIWAFEQGQITQQDLQGSILKTLQEINTQVIDYEAQLRVAEQVQSGAEGFVAAADQLYVQVTQRLANLESRLEFEKRTFAEDIDDVVHDAGDTFELEVSDRLKTDQWKLVQVWESIARTSFAKELERRIDRLVARRQESLALLKDELRLFQDEMRLTRTTILERTHHSSFIRLMPSLRVMTRITNGTEELANTTLGIGVLSGAGVGAAIYFLGSAVVLPVIAPALPYVGGAMVVAGLFKWLTDSSKRKDDEIRSKRVAFEAALRSRVTDAQASFNKQLDELAADFAQTALLLVPPIMLDAQAKERLAAVQVRVAQRLINESRAAMSSLMVEVQGIKLQL